MNDLSPRTLSSGRKLLCAVYLSFAAVALVGTWKQNLHYFRGGASALDANVRFWTEVFTGTPATTSIAVDIFMLAMAVGVWMVVEARRLRIRFVWLYVVFGFLVAISVTAPLFLVAREHRLHERGEAEAALGVGDRAVLGLLSVLVLAAVGWTIVRP